MKFKILFLVPNPIGTIPGQRFRFEQYLAYLSQKGIDYRICNFVSLNFHKILYKEGNFLKKCLYSLSGFFFRIFNIIQSLGYDLIFIYREVTPLGPPIFEKILYYFRRRIIYDFDDAIYLPSSSNVNRLIKFLKFPRKTRTIIKLSSLVLVGNRNLQSYSLQFNREVAILPTVIDTEAYKLIKKQKKEKICVGWSGSLTTIVHLSLMKEVLKKLYAKFGIIIKVIGSKDFKIEGINIQAQDWRLDSEIEDLSQIDIGLMPLPDDEWGRGKCGLKALQYMALGIPPVCSPVGVNSEIIEDGVNGFLCNDEHEWIERISLLIEDSKLRLNMGLAARRVVEERYSVKNNAPKFLKILEGVYGKRNN
ncbi:MAG: glycosyltransferase family 4 protein [Candidatus Omnitrophica bacterium]|nr:glycosyltransferase family 4 protein [Candidatus Omnitrophota bacterium]